VTFPKDPLDLTIEILLKGVWVDMTASSSGLIGGGTIDRLIDQQIGLSWGQQDETSQVQPASVSVKLDNRDGRLTPGNPRPPWWPDVDLGTQFRILVDGAVLFWGQIASIVPTWPVGDISAGLRPGECFVTITAAGVLRQLGQGRKPLRSPLFRAMAANGSHIWNFWPCEDEQGARFMASGVPVESGTALPNLTMHGFSLASDSTLPGAEPLPLLSSGGNGTWSVHVRNSTAGRWCHEWFQRCPTSPAAADSTVFVDTFTTGSHVKWTMRLGFDGTNPFLRLRSYNAAGAIVVDQLFTNPDNLFQDPWMRWRLEVADAGGGNITWTLSRSKVSTESDVVTYASGTVAGTAGAVTQVGGGVQNCPDGGFSFGFLVVHDGLTFAWLTGPDVGWDGEEAWDRMFRLCTEEGVSIAHVGGASGSGVEDRTMPMGPQPVGDFDALLFECAAADGGILTENPVFPSLIYRTRASRYNRPYLATLSAAANQITAPFTPTRDDQAIRNDVTVQRTNGAKVNLVNQASVDLHGRYTDSQTLNLGEDDSVRHVCGWLLHLGTYEGSRYPQVTIDLAVHPELIPVVQIMRVGDRIRVIDLPTQHSSWPTVDLTIEGGSHTIGRKSWTVTLNCSPAAPWTIGVWGTARWSPRGSTLTADINGSDMTIQVATTGRPWTTASTDFPLNLLIGGSEVVTATGCTGATSPQVFTLATRAVNGVIRSHLAGESVDLELPAVIGL
jgi:hypothetical protein